MNHIQDHLKNEEFVRPEKREFPFPDEMTVGSLVALLLTLPQDYQVSIWADYIGDKFRIDHKTSLVDIVAGI